MTWVKGTTTWAALATDLTKLICGEMADGVGTTVAVGDRWLREYDTTVDAIRSPASKDINTGACSMRAGYWALTTAGTEGVGRLSFMRNTVVRNSTAGARIMYRLTVDIANTVSGDYSTARLRVYSWDCDTGAVIRTGDTFNPSAAGDVSFDGMTVRIGDPTGFFPINLNFWRMFTDTYRGGIDYWPMYAKRSAAASFSTNPPGVSATDYDIVEIAPPYSYCTTSTSYSNNCHTWSRSNWGTGLGIKTNAGLTGAVYVVSFPMALHKIRLFNRSDAAGILGLTIGRMSLDGAVYRPNAAQEVSQWARAFQVAAQVVSTSIISYWMSVKSDGIVLVLSGDPGVTGKTCVSHISLLTPYDANYDVMPVIFNGGLQDYTADYAAYSAYDSAALNTYWSLRRRLDGTEGGRDWQTKWMRCDLMEYGSAWSGQAYTWDQSYTMAAWGTWTYNSNVNGRPSILPLRQLKPHPYDARWWLYGVAYGDAAAWDLSTTPANPGTMDHRQIRGVANSRWWHLPGDGWANLDELTDNSTAAKYMLLGCDYQGAGARHRINNNQYISGIAVAEV